MNIKVINNTKTVKHAITGVTGHIAHIIITGADRVAYMFAPNTCSPTTGDPNKMEMLCPSLITGGKLITVDVPIEILNTVVEDKHTGYKGIALQMCIHKNGCLHFWVQKKGVDSSGEPFTPQDFSILDLKGGKINSGTTSVAVTQIVKKARTGSPTQATYKCV